MTVDRATRNVADASPTSLRPASARAPRAWSDAGLAPAKDAEAALVVDDLERFGLPPRTPGTRLLLATGDRFFVYPTKLREYQARYRGAFLHGGVSPEEVVLPITLLTPRRS